MERSEVESTASSTSSYSTHPDPSLKPAPFYYYVDRSQEPDRDPFVPIIPVGNRISLPCRMHVILDMPEFNDIISWLPHGRSWKIHKPKEFETRILPQIWNKCTLSSFLRQSNCWGFLRLTSEGDQYCYYHEFFLRGLPHLCKNMFRSDRKKGPKDERRLAKRAYEPDLHRISEIHPLPERDNSHQLRMLKSAVFSGTDARMVVDNGTANTEQYLPESNISPQQSHSTSQQSSISLQQSHSTSQQSNNSLQLSNNTYQDRSRVQEDTATAVESPPVSPAVEPSTPSPAQQQALRQSQPWQQAQDNETARLYNMVLQQQQLSNLQLFLFPLIQMGLGSTTGFWSWLTNWCSTYQTSPIWTTEEEKQELQNLPEEERARAQADIVGSNVLVRNSSAMERDTALSLLRYKISNLPISEKFEVAEAYIRNKTFLGDEWLMHFLHAENFDADAAARRAVTYWRMRVGFLSRELAFLPFTIRNAFSRDGIQILKMGFLRLLPVTDVHGRAVLYIEPGKIHGQDYCTNILVRAFFYVCHAALEQQDIGNNGIIFLIDHSTAQARHGNAHMAQQVLSIMNYFPFKVNAVHFFGLKNMFNVMALPVIKFFLVPSLRCRILQHNEEGEDLLDKFQQFGLPPERLPTQLGGHIDLDQDRWVEERLANGL